MNVNSIRTITIPAALAAKAPKPVKDAHAAYLEALTKLAAAEQTAEDLRHAAADLTLTAAEEALAAVRSGKPIPASMKDDITARAELAERSIAAFTQLAIEREAELLDALDANGDALRATAEERHAAASTALLDAVGDALTRLLPAYRETAGEWGWTRTRKWTTTPDTWAGTSFRYRGQDTDPLALLADALRAITRLHPATRERDAKVKELMRPGFEDRRAAQALIDATPVPSWALALEVEAS